jgi:hypothetical protein
MSHVKTDKLSARTASGTITLGESGETLTVPSGVTLTNNGTASGFGKVLQVVQGIKSDTFSTTSGSYIEVTGLSVSITPSNASNNVLIIYSAAFGTSNIGNHQLRRGGVEIAPLNTDSGYYSGWNCGEVNDPNWMGMENVAYLDSPSSTSSLTYSVYCRSRSSSHTISVNRTSADTSSVDYSIRGASYIIAMEIAG